MNFLGRGKPKERRKKARRPAPAFKAFYWTGGVCQPLRVRDISESGAYLEMAADWFVGTALHLVLEHDGPTQSSAKEVLTLWARIVRADSYGMGVQFINLEREMQARFQRALETAYGGAGMRGEWSQERRAGGQAL